MTIYPNKFQNGFTFIEILVVTAVFALIALASNNVLFSSFKASQKGEAIKNVRQSGDVAITVITRKIKEAKTITSCSGSQVLIQNVDGTQSDIHTDNASPRQLSITESGVTTQLISSNMHITSGPVVTSDGAIFDCSEYLVNGSVGISFTLHYVAYNDFANIINNPNEERAQMTFQTRVVLRSF